MKIESSSSALTGGTPPQGGTEQANPFSVPPSRVGLYMTEDHRYYVNGEGPIVSVTTALEIMHKPWVVQWLMDQTAMSAMLHLGELIGISVEDGIKQIRGYRFPEQIRDLAAHVGTAVHVLSDMPLRASESDSKTFEIPNEVIPYLEAYRGFTGWLDQHGGQIVSSEKAVWNRTEGYAGTYDRLIEFECECHRGLWCVDIKTSGGLRESGKKSPGLYPEFALQCIAYARGEYIVLPDDPTLYPMPSVDRTGILHLNPSLYSEGTRWQDGWRLVEYLTTDRDYLAFLAALELYKWRAEGRFKKSVLNRSTQKPI